MRLSAKTQFKYNNAALKIRTFPVSSDVTTAIARLTSSMAVSRLSGIGVWLRVEGYGIKTSKALPSSRGQEGDAGEVDEAAKRLQAAKRAAASYHSPEKGAL